MENNQETLPESFHADAAEQVDRRSEPRYVPYDQKSVLLVAPIQVTVRNESYDGACLRTPITVEVAPSQKVQVIENGSVRHGNVRWTTIDEAGPHRLVGLHWEES